MICLVALVVFSILGIFSVRYRKLAANAVDCVFRRITFRPCQSGMDQQLRSKLIATISKKNVNLAKFVVKRFEVISWIFTALFILSIIFSARGIYFYAVYGNCNGQDSNDFCVFDALNPSEDHSSCSDPSVITNDIEFIAPSINEKDPYLGSKDAKVTIIEFGCYTCPFTKKANPVVKQITEHYGDKIMYVFKDFPLPTHDNANLVSNAAMCAKSEGFFWEYHDMLFSTDIELYDIETLSNLASSFDLDEEQFSICLENNEFNDLIIKDFEEGTSAGVYGTPTFFINDLVVVGPKPFRYFKNIIDKELKK
jgi:hypothetical protein